MADKLKIKVTRTKMIKVGGEKPMVVESNSLKVGTVQSDFDRHLSALLKVPTPNKKKL